MAKIDPDNFGDSRGEKLRQGDLNGDCAILTIAAVEQHTVKERNVLILRFKETGNRTLWLNWPKEIRAVVTELGEDSDDWVGKQVPVEWVTRTYESQEFQKAVIADGARWPGLFEQAAAEVPF